MDSGSYNEEAWDRNVAAGNRWTVPVSAAQVEAARQGDWEIILTPSRAVPREWYGEGVAGRDLLCLASGGGQQGPLLAAAGARVTVFDRSTRQLAQDRAVAARDDLDITTVHGDMRDLSEFEDESFDLIIHPCSNCFVEEVVPVWREAFRVLRPGGALLSGFGNPVQYCIDWTRYEDHKEMTWRFKIPYADQRDLTQEELAKILERGDTVEFSHTLETLIGGQLRAGFVLTDMFEDEWGTGELIDDYFPAFIATRAVKLTGARP